MATYYARGVGGNWTAAATWSLTSGGGATGATPTAADECIFDVNSGNVTVNSGAVCRSWTVNGYTGTITHTAAVTLTIGDATAGTSNRIVYFATSGWTYTLGNAATSAVALASTSATQQTITSSGRTFGNFTLNGTGSSTLLADAFTSTGTLTHNAGTFNTGNFTVGASTFNFGNATTRTLTLGSSTINLSGVSSVFTGSGSSGLTVTANTATVNLNGAVTSGSSLMVLAGANWNGLSFVTSAANQASINGGGATIGNFTITGSANKTDQYRFQNTFTVSGTLTVNGNSATNRILLFGLTPGTANTITTANAPVLSNVDFADITAAGAGGTWSGTSLGDLGGNTNITFTTPVTRYAVAIGASTNLWSDTARWSTSSGGSAGASVPLAQDTVIVDNNSFSGTVRDFRIDMPRMGKDINMSAVTTAQKILPVNGTTYSFCGSLSLALSLTVSGGTGGLNAAGRGSHTITSAGTVWTATSWIINAPGGTYTLADDFDGGATTVRTLTLTTGTFDTAGFMTRWQIYNIGSTFTKLFLRSSNVYITRQTAGGSWANSAGASAVDGGTSNIIYSLNTTGTQTFTGGGSTYYNLTSTVANSSTLTIVGSNSFNDIFFNDASVARTLQFTSGTTNTIRAVPSLTSVAGASGRLITVKSVTGGSVATLAFPNGYGGGSDWLSVQDITATTNPWYAGANSTNVSGNTNVIFSAAPAASGVRITWKPAWLS